MNNTTPPQIDWDKVKKPALIGLAIILLIIIVLLSRCDGVRNGAGNAYDWAFGGDDVTTETKLIVPDNCEILTLENGDKQVVCPDAECLTEKRYTELLCNPPECKKPTPTQTVVPPPPPPPPCKGPNCNKKKNSCEDLARETGQPWQCLNPRTYRGYKGNQIKDGLCPGVLKCMIPGKKDGTPPPHRPGEPPPTPDQVTFFCKGTDCKTLYLTDLDNPNVKILTPGVRRDPKDPRKLILPPGTREVEMEYPSNIPVEIYNFEAPDGNWSAQHNRARIVGSQEQTSPEFEVGFKRRGKTHVATPDDSIKNEDWGYRGEVPPPSNNGGSHTPDGGLEFNAQ